MGFQKSMWLPPLVDVALLILVIEVAAEHTGGRADQGTSPA
jgi:hypothetical protein